MQCISRDCSSQGVKDCVWLGKPQGKEELAFVFVTRHLQLADPSSLASLLWLEPRTPRVSILVASVNNLMFQQLDIFTTSNL